jgi:hypothetical protein
MEITNSKDMMVAVLVGMRRDVILAYENISNEPTAEEAYFTLTSYVEHVRAAREHGIKIKDIIAMYDYFDQLMMEKINRGEPATLNIVLNEGGSNQKIN